jgi:beta-lactamase class A
MDPNLPCNPRRRHLVRGGAAALALAAIPLPGCGAGTAMAAAPAAVEPFGALEGEVGGRVGVAALDLGNGAHLSHRGAERFALCSTFKWLLAAAVLGRSDRAPGVLDTRLSFARREVVGVSPVTSPQGAGGTFTVRQLCAAAVEASDNTAANALTPGSRELLLSWMRQCTTGLGRLRAGLPAGWIVGDKTGTGRRGAVNDLAIAWPPGRPPILIAAYLSDSTASTETLSAAHARIGALVAGEFA